MVEASGDDFFADCEAKYNDTDLSTWTLAVDKPDTKIYKKYEGSNIYIRIDAVFEGHDPWKAFLLMADIKTRNQWAPALKDAEIIENNEETFDHVVYF